MFACRMTCCNTQRPTVVVGELWCYRNGMHQTVVHDWRKFAWGAIIQGLVRTLLLLQSMKAHISVIVAIAALQVSAANAQEPVPKKGGLDIKKDTALLGAYVPGTGGIGGGVVVEPKIEIVDNVYAGLRTAIAITGGGSIDAGNSDVSVGVGVNVSAMAKVEYTAPTGTFRPMVGFGAGLYYLISQNVSAGENTSVNQQAGEFFGVAPQVGIEFGRGRLAATYNAVLGANVEIQQNVGGAKSVRQDYWSVELGMRF